MENGKNKDAATPLMKQYEQLKAAHPDEILLFRLGDFYEMFADDARAASPILEVALTQRQGVPMCGIPYHAMERYVAKLLKKGLRVSIAEQLEDPASAKGIVKREVIRTISAGTIIEENLLKEKSNNFLVSLELERAKDSKSLKAGLAVLDISTGQFQLAELSDGPDASNLASEIARIGPAEILIGEEWKDLASLFDGYAVHWLGVRESELGKLSKAPTIDAHPESAAHPAASRAGRQVHAYLERMNPAFLKNIQTPRFAVQSDAMTLDRETIDNLELVRNSYDGTSDKTLLEFLDRTVTPMGGRLLKQWVVRPLVHLPKIRERLRTVEFFARESSRRRDCRETLKGASDLERIAVRVLSGHAGPRDLTALRLSLLKVRALRDLLNDRRPTDPASVKIPVELPERARELAAGLADESGLIDLVSRAIADEPPIALENGGVIREGYDADLDERRRASHEGRQWLQQLEAGEREKTGISSLKIGYTSVFGYYFEVTKPHLPKVPPNWHRKQTLVNNERFVNEELKRLEEKILGAEEQCLRIEKAIFQKVVDAIKARAQSIQATAAAVAELDCFLALAEVADLKGLSRPEVDESDELSIADGWHPVVKECIPAGQFVTNDALLNGSGSRIVILTGPNMAGKSTYLRQTALIALLAQIGSFVPAKSARIGCLDRIFTRIGSGDRLAQGESTFMVEMRETARILANATNRSLVILDEVGRGTSTYDGISIAWSVIEYLAKLKAKVLFATHYFELTQLESQMDGVKNFNVLAKEYKDSVIFLHKIAAGPADRSYGIHVAQLAGLPPAVVDKAKKILDKLEQEHHSVLKSKQDKQQELSFS